MAATEWTQLRVRVSTRERLSLFIGRLITAAENGQISSIERYDRAFTLDDALVILLDRADAHQKRAKKARKAKQEDDVIDLGHTPLPDA